MKKSMPRLSLKRETIAYLDFNGVRQAEGGLGSVNSCWTTVTYYCTDPNSPTYSKTPSCVPGGCTQEN